MVVKDTLERTPLYKRHKFLAASTVNACGALSHQTPVMMTIFSAEEMSLLKVLVGAYLHQMQSELICIRCSKDLMF